MPFTLMAIAAKHHANSRALRKRSPKGQHCTGAAGRALFPAVLAGAEEAALRSSGRRSSPVQRAGGCSEQATQQGGSRVVTSCRWALAPQEYAAPPQHCCLCGEEWVIPESRFCFRYLPFPRPSRILQESLWAVRALTPVLPPVPLLLGIGSICERI